jgi:hypothetical protein
MAGLVVVVINYLQGDALFATILLVLLGVALGLLLWWTQPGRGGSHLSHADAQAAAGDRDVIVYWRTGCVYSDRLKLGLGRVRHDVLWVNILEDPEAAEFVATFHGGHQVVPTAVTGAGVMIDATPEAIKAQLASASSQR